jgi:mannose-6-phosphate isomerase-like protein (cupin superfamily)
MMLELTPKHIADESKVYRFYPESMEKGDSHGGIGSLLAERVAGQSVGSAVRHIDLVVLPPEATIAGHLHQLDNEELYIVVKGRGLMSLDERQVVVELGDVIRNRPGGYHGFNNHSGEDVWLVVVELKFDPSSLESSGDQK